MESSLGEAPTIALLDPASYVGGQPHDQFRWLRANDPVHRHAEPAGGPGYWAITRYEDIRAISRVCSRKSGQDTSEGTPWSHPGM